MVARRCQRRALLYATPWRGHDSRTSAGSCRWHSAQHRRFTGRQGEKHHFQQHQFSALGLCDAKVGQRTRTGCGKQSCHRAPRFCRKHQLRQLPSDAHRQLRLLVPQGLRKLQREALAAERPRLGWREDWRHLCARRFHLGDSPSNHREQHHSAHRHGAALRRGHRHLPFVVQQTAAQRDFKPALFGRVGRLDLGLHTKLCPPQRGGLQPHSPRWLGRAI